MDKKGSFALVCSLIGVKVGKPNDNQYLQSILTKILAVVEYFKTVIEVMI